MKIAVCLFGISYIENFDHWRNKKIDIDYRNYLINNKENVYDCFENSFIDFFISTNKNSYMNDIINYFNPKKHKFTDLIMNRTLSRNTHFNNVLKLCKEYNEEYDIIIVTRFDLYFEKKISEYVIDLTTMNITSELINNQICDNFYLFPYKYIDHMIALTSEPLVKNTSYHLLKRRLMKIFGKINYFEHELKTIQGIKFYKIRKINVNA